MSLVRSLLVSAVLLLTCCTHIHLNKRITRLPYQSEKFDAMNLLGKPFQVKRKYGLDYWIYKFKVEDGEYIRQIVFKEGRLIRKGKPVPYPAPRLVLDGVENLTEYEEAVEQFQQQKAKHKGAKQKEKMDSEKPSVKKTGVKKSDTP